MAVEPSDPPAADWSMTLPFGELCLPDYLLTDLLAGDGESRDLLARHLSAYLAEAQPAPGREGVLGMRLEVSDAGLCLRFGPVRLAGRDYAGPQDLPEPEQARLGPLLDRCRAAVQAAVQASRRGTDWLPEAHRTFAGFFDGDDRRRGWPAVYWTAMPWDPAKEMWLRSPGGGLRQWGRHPCSGALVVAFAEPEDLRSFHTVFGMTPARTESA